MKTTEESKFATERLDHARERLSRATTIAGELRHAGNHLENRYTEPALNELIDSVRDLASVLSRLERRVGKLETPADDSPNPFGEFASSVAARQATTDGARQLAADIERRCAEVATRLLSHGKLRRAGQVAARATYLAGYLRDVETTLREEIVEPKFI